MDSLEERSSFAIDYINHEIKLKADSELRAINSTKELLQEFKEKEDIQVHPEITLHIQITTLIMFAIVLLFGISLKSSDYYWLTDRGP